MFGLFAKETYERELLPKAKEVLAHIQPVMPRICANCQRSPRGTVRNYGQSSCPACHGQSSVSAWPLELLTCATCGAQGWPDRKADPNALEYASDYFTCGGCKTATMFYNPLQIRIYPRSVNGGPAKEPPTPWRNLKTACERLLQNSPPFLAEWMRITRIPPGLWNVQDPLAEYDEWLKAPKVRHCKSDRTFYPEHLPACPTCRKHHDQTLMRDPTSTPQPIPRRPGPDRRCPTCSAHCTDDDRLACYYCLTTLPFPAPVYRVPIPPIPSTKPKPTKAEMVARLEGHHRDIFFHLFPEYKKFAAAK